MFTLPLWVVTEHIQPTSPEHTPEQEPGTALVFSSVEKLAEFKRARRGGEWKIEVADDREGLVIVIADLHRLIEELFDFKASHVARFFIGRAIIRLADRKFLCSVQSLC